MESSTGEPAESVEIVKLESKPPVIAAKEWTEFRAAMTNF